MRIWLKKLNQSFEFGYEFSVFPLGGASIDGNNAAVVSSGDYPNVDTTQGRTIFINDIPGGVYVTYTLLTSAKQGFKHDQLVDVDGRETRDRFNATLTSPFSHHKVTRGEISIKSVRDTFGDEENPVFLIQYSGMRKDPKQL